jgi:hypothetical protein
MDHSKSEEDLDWDKHEEYWVPDEEPFQEIDVNMINYKLYDGNLRSDASEKGMDRISNREYHYEDETDIELEFIEGQHGGVENIDDDFEEKLHIDEISTINSESKIQDSSESNDESESNASSNQIDNISLEEGTSEIKSDVETNEIVESLDAPEETSTKISDSGIDDSSVVTNDENSIIESNALDVETDERKSGVESDEMVKSLIPPSKHEAEIGTDSLQEM